MSNTVYPTSPIKRKRRSNDELGGLLNSCLEIIGEQGDDALTIRHLFYRLVSAKAIEKTEAEYGNLCGHLSKWRKAGKIRFDAFTDNTRWHYGQDTFNSLDEALQNTVENYRRNLWSSQPAHVEIWCEKDAIASILLDAANSFGVKVFVCRGFASLTSLHSAAQTFRRATRQGKDVTVYYFGDHDPSGRAIDKAIQNTLANNFDVEFNLFRVAVTREQIVEHNLPTRPPKAKDGRSKGWEGGCVEIDAMSPATLKGLVHDFITRHINPHEWAQIQQAEEMERGTLQRIRSIYGEEAA